MPRGSGKRAWMIELRIKRERANGTGMNEILVHNNEDAFLQRHPNGVDRLPEKLRSFLPLKRLNFAVQLSKKVVLVRGT